MLDRLRATDRHTLIAWIASLLMLGTPWAADHLPTLAGQRVGSLPWPAVAALAPAVVAGVTRLLLTLTPIIRQYGAGSGGIASLVAAWQSGDPAAIARELSNHGVTVAPRDFSDVPTTILGAIPDLDPSLAPSDSPATYPTFSPLPPLTQGTP